MHQPAAVHALQLLYEHKQYNKLSAAAGLAYPTLFPPASSALISSGLKVEVERPLTLWENCRLQARHSSQHSYALK